MYYRDTYIKINCDAIEYNLKYLKQQAKKDLIGVVKANAYGHCDYWAAITAMKAGCVMVAVSCLDEALALRKQGFKDQILVLGHIRPKDFDVATQNDITVTVVSLEWLNAVLEMNPNLRNIKFHIKINSGMNRIGLRNLEDTYKAIELIEFHNGIVEGIFTHYACADEEDKTKCNQQYKKFKNIVENCNYDFKWIHCENSAAILCYGDDITNLARAGLAMYGISPLENPSELKPALSLITHLVNVQEISKGETIGYGATYTAEENCIIGTIPIGYADGLIRANQGRKLYCCGEWVEIVGKVCMDQCMVKLNHKYPIGTAVEIISDKIPAYKMAEELKITPYELLCQLSDRIARKIKINGVQVVVINNRLNGSNN